MSSFSVMPLRRDDSQQEIAQLFKDLTKRLVSVNVMSLASLHNCFCFVAKSKQEDQQNIGFVALTLRNTPTRGLVGTIEDLVVSKHHRREGIGEELMRTIIQKAMGMEVNELELTSDPKRETARNLYKKLGFKLIDTGVFRHQLN